MSMNSVQFAHLDGIPARGKSTATLFAKQPYTASTS